MNKKVLFFLFCSLASSLSLKAQMTSLYNPHGDPLMEKEYVDVKGSAYYNDEWLDGIVVTKDGKSYKTPLKFDLVKNYPCFKGEKGETMRFADPVAEFSILEDRFKSGYPASDGHTSSTYYKILADGKVQLLQFMGKEIIKEKEFNSAVTIKEFEFSTDYYAFTDGKILPFRKDKKALFAIFGDKTPAAEKFIADQKLNLKNEGDIIKLISYYNTL